ncbi:MAG: hypothetical protein HY060_12685 [Proteobacteria bacterium]|nr:hypothetical protein [Pseudomonadota bacterium]
MAAKRSPDAAIETTSTPAAAAAPAGDAAPDGVVPRVRRAVHDLRQPVQAMRLFVHLLSTRLERDEDRALVVKLDEALENIEAALRGLMNSVAPTGAAADAPAADGSAPSLNR